MLVRIIRKRKRRSRPSKGSVIGYELPLGVNIINIRGTRHHNGIGIGLTSTFLVQTIIGWLPFSINIIKACCAIRVVYLNGEHTSCFVICIFLNQRNTSASIVVSCTTTMTYVFPRTIVDYIVILSSTTIICSCIQEIPQHIITKYIIGCNGVICLGRYIETLERIRLNQIKFLVVSICRYLNGRSCSCWFISFLLPWRLEWSLFHPGAEAWGDFEGVFALCGKIICIGIGRAFKVKSKIIRDF